jgi:predicted GNAT family acetyltransferase
MVNARRTTPVSSRIGPVYTPPAHRGRGYAGALTAAVTDDLLAGGDPRVTLFTDETNATSNALYARIGYRDVGAQGSWLVRRA